MPDILTKYDNLHLKNIARTGSRILLIFEEAIYQIAFTAQYVRFKGGTFSLDKFPFLKQQIEAALLQMHGDIAVEIVNSIKESWDISNKKNNLLVDRRLAGSTPTEGARQILYDPNLEARNAFIYRKERGLNLSKRVWNTLQPFKMELERGLAVGIGEGQPAAEMAKNLKKYLRDPDKLFRRVRNMKGDLVLSKAAKNYSPGQGVYRSAFKNSMRLTRTETNLAYQNADFERWQKLPFVKGIEVRLSNRHKVYDVCDHLKGLYPKNFHFIAWHPQCLCSAIPVLATDEEYDLMEDYTLGRTDKKPVIESIKSIPDSAENWIKNNAERIKNWSNTPYFIRENPKYLKPLLNK